MDPSDELADLKKRMTLLAGDKKAYFETSEWTKRANKETVATLRRENKELRDRLAELQKEERQFNMSASHSAVKGHLETELFRARQKHDESKHQCTELERELVDLQVGVNAVERTERRYRPDDNPVVQSVRTLENRLEKAMIKYNEAQSIRKTYEQIMRRLQEERLGFDSQLSAMDRMVQMKDSELKELDAMAADAMHAKDVVETELDRFEKAVESERKAREHELNERRQQVQTRTEMNERLEKRNKQHESSDGGDDISPSKPLSARSGSQPGLESVAPVKEEESEKKITTYEDAFRKIKEATGVSDVNEVIQKFLTQEDTHNNLLQLKAEAQSQIDSLGEEKLQLKGKVEEIKYSGSGSMGNRRVIDEFEAHLGEANVKCEHSRQKYERIAKILINVKAGIEHLGDKLESVKIDLPPVVMSEDTVVDVLFQCEQKLQRLIESVGAVNELSELHSRQTKTLAEPELPAYNIRIKLPAADEEEAEWDEKKMDGEEPEEEGEDVLDREAIKRNASQALEKATKKKKGRGGPRRKPRDSTGPVSTDPLPLPRGARSMGRRADHE